MLFCNLFFSFRNILSYEIFIFQKFLLNNFSIDRIHHCTIIILLENVGYLRFFDIINNPTMNEYTLDAFMASPFEQIL